MTRLNLALLGVLIACALALVTAQQRSRKLYVELQQEQEQEKKFEVEWNQLQLEQSKWAVHARIEKIAIQDLRMRAPTAARTQLVPRPAAQGTATPPAGSPAK